jgi:predicted dehydrogenase
MRIGVFGAGVIGQLRARSVRENPAAELVGIADVDEAAARQAVGGSGAVVYRHYRELLERARADAVIISTPVHLHEEMALEAIAAGAHVLCEKPLSNTTDSCRTILDAAVRRGRVMAVGFNHRYYPSVRFMKAAVDAGDIGTIDHLRVFGGHDGLSNFRADWMYKAPLSGGGAMMDVGIHMTDLVRFFIGEIGEVYGVATERFWHVPGSEDNAMAILKNDAGIAALYQATWAEWKGYKIFIEAYGERGMVRASYAPMFNLIVTQDRPGGRRRRRLKMYPELIVREKLQGWESTTYATFQAELSDFLARLGGAVVPLADGWAGLRAVEIAAAVRESSTSGAPVRLSRPPLV